VVQRGIRGAALAVELNEVSAPCLCLVHLTRGEGHTTQFVGCREKSCTEKKI